MNESIFWASFSATPKKFTTAKKIFCVFWTIALFSQNPSTAFERTLVFWPILLTKRGNY